MAVIGIALSSCSVAAPSASTAVGSGNVQQGKYILLANGGCGCHGPNLGGYKADSAAELPASAPFGEPFDGPFGSIRASNITPDKKTGIGNVTDAQAIDAVRNGIGKESRQIFPIMPYPGFHFMADTDVRNLVAYLRGVPAIANAVPDRQLTGPLPSPPQLPPSPPTAPLSGLERNQEGALDVSKLLAGAAVPREGGRFEIALNVTPDQATGIGAWSEQQIATSLRTRVRPDGTRVGLLMAQQINGGYNQLLEADALAIAAYIKSDPAVSNQPQPPPPSGATPVPGETTLPRQHR